MRTDSTLKNLDPRFEAYRNLSPFISPAEISKLVENHRIRSGTIIRFQIMAASIVTVTAIWFAWPHTKFAEHPPMNRIQQTASRPVSRVMDLSQRTVTKPASTVARHSPISGPSSEGISLTLACYIELPADLLHLLGIVRTQPSEFSCYVSTASGFRQVDMRPGHASMESLTDATQLSSEECPVFVTDGQGARLFSLDTNFEHRGVALDNLIPLLLRPLGNEMKAIGKSDYVLWYQPTHSIIQLLNAVNYRQYVDYLGPVSQWLPSNVESTLAVTIDPQIDDSIYFKLPTAEEGLVMEGIANLAGKSFVYLQYENSEVRDRIAQSIRTLNPGMYILSFILTQYPFASKRYAVRFWKESPATALPVDMSAKSVPADASFIELDSLQMSNLGVRDIGKQVVLTQMEEGHPYSHWFDRPQGSSYVNRKIPLGLAPVNFFPTFITSGQGAIHSYSGSDRISSDEAMVAAYEKINQLIPILLRANRAADTLVSADFILWYQPTKEFLAALPKVVANKLRRVYNIPDSLGLKQVAQSLIAQHGAITSVAAFPNPAKDKLRVQIQLEAPRVCEMILRDLAGHEVYRREISKFRSDGDTSIDVATYAEGIYLLEISTEKGERFLQRIVIRK
jgi:hypothetical protein